MTSLDCQSKKNVKKRSKLPQLTVWKDIETTQVGKSCELLVLLYAARLANLQDMLYMLQDSRTSSQDCKKIIYYMLQDSRTTF